MRRRPPFTVVAYIGLVLPSWSQRSCTTSCATGLERRRRLRRGRGWAELSGWAQSAWARSRSARWASSYAMLTGRDPADSSFTAGLDRAEARWLARLADGWAR